jgi:hypothetical protein
MNEQTAVKKEAARILAESAAELMGNRAFNDAVNRLQEELLARLETDPADAAIELRALRRVKQYLQSYIDRGPPHG